MAKAERGTGRSTGTSVPGSEADARVRELRPEGLTARNELDPVGGSGTSDRSADSAATELSVEEQMWDMHAQAYVTDTLSVRYPTLLSEVAVGTNWIDAAAIINVQDRAYPKREGWMFGTADVVGLSEDNEELYVGDWKTGGSEGADEQLLSLATVLFRAMNRLPIKRVVISVLSVTENGVKPTEREVYAELDSHWVAMGWQWTAVQKGEAKPSPGIHCTALYCPHLSHCAAVKGLVLDASEGEKGLLAPENIVRRHHMTDRPQSDEEAGYVMERVTAARRQLNYYTEAMKEYCREGGMVLSGKYEWGPGPDGFRWRRRKLT